VALASPTFPWKSTMVASASTSFPSGTNRDVVSTIVALGSNLGRFSAGLGMFPAELSPANGVPTPGGPGFLGTGFLSDRAESLILSSQKLPGARGSGNPVGPAVERPCVDNLLKSYPLQLNEVVMSMQCLLIVKPSPQFRISHFQESTSSLSRPRQGHGSSSSSCASRIERYFSIMMANDPFGPRTR
jgi:hypothetical protein